MQVGQGKTFRTMTVEATFIYYSMESRDNPSNLMQCWQQLNTWQMLAGWTHCQTASRWTAPWAFTLAGQDAKALRTKMPKLFPWAHRPKNVKTAPSLCILESKCWMQHVPIGLVSNALNFFWLPVCTVWFSTWSQLWLFIGPLISCYLW